MNDPMTRLHRISRRALASVALLAATSTLPAAALAQRPSHTEADSERARELFGRAVTAIDAKQFERARELLTQALGLMESFDIAGALGQTELELGSYRDAAEHLSYSLRQFPPSESRKLKQKVAEGLAEAKRHVGTVQVEVVPAEGATVFLDSNPVRMLPLETDLFVAPGPHTLEARWQSEGSEAQQSATVSIEASAGQEYPVRLVPATEPPASASGAASTGDAIETGAEPGALTQEEPAATEKSWVPVYVGAGVTAVGLGTWIGFAVAANAAQDDADAYRKELSPDGCTTGTADADTCRASQDAYDRQRRARTVSRIGMGVTIVGALATAGYVLFWPDRPATSTAWVHPAVDIDPTGGTVYLGGSF